MSSENHFTLTGASPAGDSALTLNEGARAPVVSLFQNQTEAAIPPPMAATDPANAVAGRGGVLWSCRLLLWLKVG